METFSALLALCAGHRVTGEFPSQRPVTRSFDVFFDLCWINGWVKNAGDLRRQIQVWIQHMIESYISVKNIGNIFVSICCGIYTKQAMLSSYAMV